MLESLVSPIAVEIPEIGDAERTNLETSPRVRAAAAVALQELGQLRWAERSMARETFDAEVERIARVNFRPCGCDLIVRRMGNSSPRFFIHTEATGKTCDLITHFFHHEDSNNGSAETGSLPPGSRVVDGLDPSPRGVALTATATLRLVASSGPQ